jgi:hypothetical protein
MVRTPDGSRTRRGSAALELPVAEMCFIPDPPTRSGSESRGKPPAPARRSPARAIVVHECPSVTGPRLRCPGGVSLHEAAFRRRRDRCLFPATVPWRNPERPQGGSNRPIRTTRLAGKGVPAACLTAMSQTERMHDASVDVTGERNIASQIAFGGADRSAKGLQFAGIGPARLDGSRRSAAASTGCPARTLAPPRLP